MSTPKRIENLYKKLINSEKFLFPPEGHRLPAPKEKGVYIIFNQKGKSVHVGCTPRARNGILQRLKNHLRGQSSFVKKYLQRDGSKLRKGYSFQFRIVSEPKDRKFLEALTIGKLCPEHIGEG